MPQNYFRHDYNASTDEKILELRTKHGWEGYGLFWVLLERMARLEEGTINPDKARAIAMGINAEKEKLSDLIETCIEVGLFVKDEDGLYRNKRITKHIKKMEQQRENGRKGSEIRWSKDSDRGAIGETNTTPNADKIREDNNKGSIVSKSRFTLEEGEDFSDPPKGR